MTNPASPRDRYPAPPWGWRPLRARCGPVLRPFCGRQRACAPPKNTFFPAAHAAARSTRQSSCRQWHEGLTRPGSLTASCSPSRAGFRVGSSICSSRAGTRAAVIDPLETPPPRAPRPAAPGDGLRWEDSGPVLAPNAGGWPRMQLPRSLASVRKTCFIIEVTVAGSLPASSRSAAAVQRIRNLAGCQCLGKACCRCISVPRFFEKALSPPPMPPLFSLATPVAPSPFPPPRIRSGQADSRCCPLRFKRNTFVARESASYRITSAIISAAKPVGPWKHLTFIIILSSPTAAAFRDRAVALALARDWSVVPRPWKSMAAVRADCRVPGLGIRPVGPTRGSMPPRGARCTSCARTRR